MIIDTVKNIQDYRTAMSQSMQVKNEALKFIKKNYVRNSPVFVQAEKQCLQVFDESIRPLKKDYSEAIQSEFEAIRKKIADCVTTPVPDELLKLAPMIPNMSALEKEMLMKKYSGNYLASKLINFGNDDFVTLEHLMDDLDDLQNEMVQVSERPIDDYMTMNLMNGTWTSRVSDEVNSFIDTYLEKKGGEDDV